MKPWHSFLTHEWRVKLTSLALATLLWLFLRHSINYSPAPPPFPVPPLLPGRLLPLPPGGNRT